MMDNVLYVYGAGCNLFSPGLALDHGYEMSWDLDSRIICMKKDKLEVIRTHHKNRLWSFETHNIDSPVNPGYTERKRSTKNICYANSAVTNGVEDLTVWHDLLGHTCPEYMRLMVDRGMAKGIMLQRRGKVDCPDCHLGKQRRKSFRKTIDRRSEGYGFREFVIFRIT